MDYSFDSETRMLAESVGRFVADHADAPNDPWPVMAELGWLRLPFSEEAGGIGLGAIGTMVLMEGFGAGLLSTSYIPSVVIAGGVLSRSAGQAERLSPLIEGVSRVASASFGESDAIKARVRNDGSDHRLNGTDILVLGAVGADTAMVPARDEGSSAIDFFLVPLDAAGVELQALTLADGRSALRMRLTDLALPAAQRVNDAGDGRVIYCATRDAALLAAAAENLGAMQTLFDLTLDYAKTRKQFGRAIGSFQAIQFRLVDLWIKLDEARSLLMTATMAADEDHADASRLAAGAWIQTLWSGNAICEEAIQIHGAIGMADESAIGRYVKTILVNELLLGPAERHLARFRSLRAT